MKRFVKAVFLLAIALSVPGVSTAGECDRYFSTIRNWLGHKHDNDGKCEMENVPDGSEYPAHSIPYRLRNGREICPKHRYEMDWEYVWKNGKRISGIRHLGSKMRMTVKFRDSFVPVSPLLIWKNDGIFCEVPVDANGKPDGIVREYDTKGKLIHGQRMVRGEREGGYVEFTKDGEIKSFVCEGKPLFDGDAKRCGFNGKPSVVELSDGTLVTHENGKLTVKETFFTNKTRTVNKYSYSGSDSVTIEIRNYHKNGALFRSYTEKNKKRVGKFLEYTDSGKLVLEREYGEGNRLSEKTYYLNGTQKEVTVYNPDGKSFSKKEYWDNGRLKTSGEYLFRRRHYGSDTVPFGKMYEYSEAGALTEEAHYDNKGNLDGRRLEIDEKGKRTESVYRKGNLASKKIVSADGKVELNEEYYEDGSRKQ